MYTQMILGAIAGLSLFLYGMQLMGDGLQKVAGEGLKGIIRRLTKNRLMSVLVGMFVTTIIQSSSATTVMSSGPILGRPLQDKWFPLIYHNGHRLS